MSDDIDTGNFDVSFIDETNVVRIRSCDDLKKARGALMKSGKAKIWCDGFFSEVRRPPSKRVHGCDEVGDAPSKQRKT